jgi:Family of unknown function (DUF6167)
MRRLFWTALGAAAGIFMMRKVTKAVEAYTPAGLGRSAAGIGEGLRELSAAIREGMAEREEELRAALGVGGDDPRSPAASWGDDPSGRHAQR